MYVCINEQMQNCESIVSRSLKSNSSEIEKGFLISKVQIILLNI